MEEFLSKHLPRSFEVSQGGIVINKQGETSSQIDLIISNDLGLNFKEHGKMFTCIESIAAAISIKSNLDKDKLEQALDEFASIPQPDLSVIIGDLEGIETEFISKYPSLILFAYDGLTAKTIKKLLKSYYKGKSIQHNRYPHFICVNNKYIIWCFKPYTTGKSDVEFHFEPLTEEQIGKMYAAIIGVISQYNSYTNDIRYEFGQYFI